MRFNFAIKFPAEVKKSLFERAVLLLYTVSEFFHNFLLGQILGHGAFSLSGHGSRITSRHLEPARCFLWTSPIFDSAHENKEVHQPLIANEQTDAQIGAVTWALLAGLGVPVLEPEPELEASSTASGNRVTWWQAGAGAAEHCQPCAKMLNCVLSWLNVACDWAGRAKKGYFGDLGKLTVRAHYKGLNSIGYLGETRSPLSSNIPGKEGKATALPSWFTKST